MKGMSLYCGLAGVLWLAALAPGSPFGECTGWPTGAELNLTNCTLLGRVVSAWEIPPWQHVINNGPAWVASDRFSIRAKAPHPLRGSKDINPMMRQLLGERFGLVWHREKRETPAFFLSVVRSGPGLKPTPAGACIPPDPAAPPGPPVLNGCNALRAIYTQDGEGILIDGIGIQMSSLIRQLSFLLNREIVDQTGLSGGYDVSLHVAREAGMPGPPVLPLAKEFSQQFPSVFTAIRKSGLALTAGKAPVDVLVIDNAHKPSEN